MKKQKLDKAVDARITEIREILQIIYDAHNQGQKKQLIKVDKVKAIFDFFGVSYEE